MRRALSQVTKLCNANNTRATGSVNNLSMGRSLIPQQTSNQFVQFSERTRQRYWYRQEQEQHDAVSTIPYMGVSALLSVCFLKRNKNRYNHMADLTTEIMPAMVHIECKNSSLGTCVAGTGFIISKRGYIITSDSVIQGAREINVQLCDGKLYAAKVRHQDTTDDLALLQLTHPPADCDLHALELTDCNQLRVGEEVLSIRQTNGTRQLTVSKGMISCALKEVEDRIIETSQSPNCNAGGFLIDLDGKVVGMIITSMNKANMVVPSWVIKQFLTDLSQRICNQHTNPDKEKPEKVIPPFTGLSLAPLADIRYIANVDDDCDGLRVQRVIKNSPADKAGIRVGDVITKVSGRKVKEVDDFYSTLVDPSCSVCKDRRKVTVWRKDGFHEDVFMAVEPRCRALYE